MEFHINNKEAEEIKKFKEEHKNCALKELGNLWFSTIGGQFTYEITPTGLGPIIKIKCNACGKEEDVTDSESW